PAMGCAVVDQRTEAHRFGPGVILAAEADVELAFEIFLLIGADDHIGFIGGDIKVAVKTGGINGCAEVFDGGVVSCDRQRADIVVAEVSSLTRMDVAADIADAAFGGREHIETIGFAEIGFWLRPIVLADAVDLPDDGMEGVAGSAFQVEGVLVHRKSRRIKVFDKNEGSLPTVADIAEIPDLSVVCVKPGGIRGIIEFPAVGGEGDAVEGEGVFLSQEMQGEDPGRVGWRLLSQAGGWGIPDRLAMGGERAHCQEKEEKAKHVFSFKVAFGCCRWSSKPVQSCSSAIYAQVVHKSPSFSAVKRGILTT